MRKPPAILRIGAVTPLGDDWPTTWRNLLAGKSVITTPENVSLISRVSAPVSAIAHLEHSSTQSASALIGAAIDQVAMEPRARYRLWTATNHGEAELALADYEGCGPSLQDQDFGAARASWIASACTGGLHALWFAWLEAHSGHEGPWLVAAGDTLSSIGVAGFFAAGATGGGAAEPFRSGSGGMIVGEGAIAFELASGAESDAPRIMAVAVSSDAGHPTHPDPQGRWLERCIVEVLERAGCAPSEIVAVIAHGTGTKANDNAEGGVLYRIFGSDVAIVSVKAAVGHIMGSSGLLNVAAAAEIWRSGALPPTLGSSAPSFPLRLSKAGDNVASRRPVLALASGFGGNNVAAIVA